MARNAQGLSHAGSTTTVTKLRKHRPIESNGLAAEPQTLTDADVWGRAGLGRSWLRSLLAASPLILAPVGSISIFVTLGAYQGSLSLFAAAVREHGFWNICVQHGPQITLKGIAAVICWVGVQAVLYNYLPGEDHKGQITPAGHLLSYRINGLSAWFVTHLLYGVLSWLGILDPGFIPRNWSSLIGAMNLAGFVISALAFAKAYMLPTHREDRKFSGMVLFLYMAWPSRLMLTSLLGSSLYDFYMGIELNPRLGERFDLKQFSNGRAGMMVWTLIDFSNMAYQYQTQLYVEPSLILVTALQTIYVVDFFINESWYLRTIDIAHDHYGFYLAWGCFCFLPTTYTIQGQYLGLYPTSPPTLYLAFFFALGLAGYVLFRSVNHQKDKVRRTGGKCTIWGKPAECIVASFRTSDANLSRGAQRAHGPPGRSYNAAWSLPLPVVLEFPGITSEGGFTGTSGESSSFRHGFFNETVNFVEIVLGNGDAVKASHNEREDLFYGAAGAAGTLGITALLEIRLVEARRFVKTTYHKFGSVSAAISRTREECQNTDVDYVDAILYSGDHGVIITGELIDMKPDEFPI
ncbi:hypothetical protein F66182_5267 [Fusarium sp. NRRL 66182]|nr:hypothetical protein F66182_5267 [Fusarium sp. NRRL 66182]